MDDLTVVLDQLPSCLQNIISSSYYHQISLYHHKEMKDCPPLTSDQKGEKERQRSTYMSFSQFQKDQIWNLTLRVSRWEQRKVGMNWVFKNSPLVQVCLESPNLFL